jgi:hypothetical protein
MSAPPSNTQQKQHQIPSNIPPPPTSSHRSGSPLSSLNHPFTFSSDGTKCGTFSKRTSIPPFQSQPRQETVNVKKETTERIPAAQQKKSKNSRLSKRNSRLESSPSALSHFTLTPSHRLLLSLIVAIVHRAAPFCFRDCRSLLAGAEARCCTCAQIARSLQVSRAS